jgi:hypothetical protein
MAVCQTLKGRIDKEGTAKKEKPKASQIATLMNDTSIGPKAEVTDPVNHAW